MNSIQFDNNEDRNQDNNELRKDRRTKILCSLIERSPMFPSDVPLTLESLCQLAIKLEQMIDTIE